MNYQEFDFTKILGDPTVNVFQDDVAPLIYKPFFNWIINAEQSPKSILNQLNNITYLYEEDSSYIYSRPYKALVAFACLEALALRRPKVLEGAWKRVLDWILLHSFPMERYYEELVRSKYIGTTKEWILNYCSPELCPNPFLRLELFILMRIFKINGDEIFKISLIRTLYELDNENHLVTYYMQKCTAEDLAYVIKNNSLQIKDILNSDYYNTSERIRLIATIVNLSRKFALIESEKVSCELVLSAQLEWACLRFCGLIGLPDFSRDLEAFTKFVSKHNLLLNYVADTLVVISDIISQFEGMEKYLLKNSLYRIISCLKKYISHLLPLYVKQRDSWY